jgi:RND family efflux transporter MFP subunit
VADRADVTRREAHERSDGVRRRGRDVQDPLASPRGSGLRLALVITSVAAVFAGLFVYGYLPRRTRESRLVEDATRQTLPIVSVVVAQGAPAASQLTLPGNIQPVTEAPIMARCWNESCRSNGYLIKRYVDIGDRVKAGQPMGEITSPDLDQQIHQARAAVEQNRAALANAEAILVEAQANADLAKVTAERWQALLADGVVAVQEADQTQAAYKALTAKVMAAKAAIRSATENVSASEAYLRRLREWQDYEKIRAPFTGIVTERNVDIGALIDSGTTVLFRVGQIDVLRIFVNVPQSDARDVQVGQPAAIAVREYPRRPFVGKVTRTANALDPSTRTLLTEVQVTNPDQLLLPGMYAQVRMTTTRTDRPIVIPGDAVVVRSEGPLVAVLDSGRKVHFQRVELGRDFGRQVEVTSGLTPGVEVVVHPGDEVREGVTVQVEKSGGPALVPAATPSGRPSERRGAAPAPATR